MEFEVEGSVALPRFATLLDEAEEAHGMALIALPEGALSLDFLQAIYRSASQPLPVRMRAAMAALPFEYPKLAATMTANLSEDEFGNRLERARQRIVEGIPPRALDAPRPEPKPLPRPGLPK